MIFTCLLGEVMEDQMLQDCNNPFPTLYSPPLLFSYSFPSSPPHPNNGNMCIYVKMHANIYANTLIYVITFKSKKKNKTLAHIHTNNSPFFEQKN